MPTTTRALVLFSFVTACSTDAPDPGPGFDDDGTTAAPAQETTSSTTDEPEPEPEPETSSEETTADPTEAADDTGDGWVPYQACGPRSECPDEADECHVYVAHVPVRYCTVHCEDERDCPPPPSGETVPRCDPYLGYDYCALDCEDAFCPSGMGCFDVTLVDDTEVKRCGWVDS